MGLTLQEAEALVEATVGWRRTHTSIWRWFLIGQLPVFRLSPTTWIIKSPDGDGYAFVDKKKPEVNRT
jgi:hypothetical protein